MANVLKHRFTSGKADGADATQIQPSHWNDGHAFTGGSAGQVLTRDPTDATYGANWTTPGTAGHHATHEPGGADALVGAAWTTVANTFVTSQSITGDLTLTGSVTEQSRSTPLGHWIAVPFSAGNFLAPSGGTFTASVPQVNRYTLIGRTMIWTMVMGGSVAGGPITKLRFLMPLAATRAFMGWAPVVAFAAAYIHAYGFVSSANLGAIDLDAASGNSFPNGTVDVRFTLSIGLD